MNNLTLRRYQKAHSEIVNYVLNQEDIFCEITHSCTGIEIPIYRDIINKELFVIEVVSMDTLVGVFCLLSFDWESRCCRVKGGLFRTQIQKSTYDEMAKIITSLFDFCKNELRLYRIWGVEDKQSLLSEFVQEVFTHEGTTPHHKYDYYGLVF